MDHTFHFISGLPRSGSTLLSAILRQNPKIHAGMSSPIGHIFRSIFSSMGAGNEFAIFLTERQKRAILRSVFDSYYGEMDEPREIIFDTNRLWTTRMAILQELFPGSKVICCVRNPAWILDSVEVLIRKNALDHSRMFSDAESSTVFSRADALQRRDRMIGFAWSALKEAYFGEHADKLLLVEYDLLVKYPADTMELIYQFTGLDEFKHDFDDVEYQAEDFDNFMMAKDLHTVRKKVEWKPRNTVLPPDLFKQFEGLQFWNENHPTKANRITMKSAGK
ncbi:MAG: sulfotransferase [Hyphomicrobiaceae bacterium]|nr:sulfotransferase [Hyphomicrobiaceae bacterium]